MQNIVDKPLDEMFRTRAMRVNRLSMDSRVKLLFVAVFALSSAHWAAEDKVESLFSLQWAGREQWAHLRHIILFVLKLIFAPSVFPHDSETHVTL